MTRLTILALATLLFPTRELRSGGYLPALGPAALRFDSPPEASLARAPLPPLDPPIDTAPNALAESPNPNPASTDPATSSTFDPASLIGPPIPGDPLASHTQAASPASSESTHAQKRIDDAKVTPQMLLQFFKQNSPGRTAAILAPATFTPPPPSAPSSSATFRKE